MSGFNLSNSENPKQNFEGHLDQNFMRISKIVVFVCTNEGDFAQDRKGVTHHLDYLFLKKDIRNISYIGNFDEQFLILGNYLLCSRVLLTCYVLCFFCLRNLH